MKLFDEPYQFKNAYPCPEHKTYKVMIKPTADCKHCRSLWQQRCIEELGYREIVNIVADKKAISNVRNQNVVLFWDDSGKCIAISTEIHNFWFTVDPLESFFQKYSMVTK